MSDRQYRDLSNEELRNAQALGAVTMAAAYVHLMARELGVDDSDFVEINQMARAMVDPINLVMEATWRSLMNDTSGMAETMERLRRAIATASR